ncbi:MAG TPA: TetR family transcriptional regulator, partial [Egibacteraceae bacterium]|nr:TetR family transcriptional regulator [Egibacteraceae bacterium]
MTSPAARRSRGDQTRERLLDAAEELMAERGVHGPSLAEITTRAGQRNNSALSYHFGGREGLLRALAARHQE